MTVPKYYAIRMHNMIIVRRTLTGLRRIVSVLSKPGTQFTLKQTTYSGGIVLGVVPYKGWIKHGGPEIGSYKLIERSLAKSMKPFMAGSEK